MRKPPAIHPPEVVVRPDDTVVTQRRVYQFITPLFGGGVMPGEADTVTPVRGAEIRGQLRFWWRACRGGQFNGKLQRMKEKEDWLWGASSTDTRPCPSQVQIAVELKDAGQDDAPFEIVQVPDTQHGGFRNRARPRAGSAAHPYAAFPLQPTDEDLHQTHIRPKAMRSGITFTLTISFPADQRREVEAALWAWETFGGLGARTRRGFGAISCIELDGKPQTQPDTTNAEAVIRAGLTKHVTEGVWPDNVPHLSRIPKMKVVPSATNAAGVWRTLIEKLKNFRQLRSPDMQPNKPGRSKWPEPEAIRGLTGQRKPIHQRLPVQVDRFPRAAFGLPIIFHFKDGDRHNPNNPNADPRDTTLQGRDHDRLSSPLILRPLTCANNRAVGLALILESPRTLPGGLMLKDAPGNPTVCADLQPSEAAQIAPLQGNPNVLEAFLKTL